VEVNDGSSTDVKIHPGLDVWWGGRDGVQKRKITFTVRAFLVPCGFAHARGIGPHA
jgi:hypothetical protein